ncbi:MAG: L,D-transpeptidase family protein [Lachnospiraceae bacterium]|nr:L,D-transpeptidase family protein [Lachnospiraceae bacterium]
MKLSRVFSALLLCCFLCAAPSVALHAAAISSGLYEITSATSDDFVLDAMSCTVLETEYHSLQLYDRLNVNQQKFYLEEIPGSAWRLSVLSSGEALTFSETDGSLTLSELLQDSSLSTRKIQSFTFTDAGDGCFYIMASDGTCLTLDSSFAHRGTTVAFREFTGRVNQKWRLTSTWASNTDNADTDLSNPYEEGGIYEDLILTIKTDALQDELTAETVSDWVSISEDHQLVYDTDAVTAFMQALSDQYSTLDNGHPFTTSLGATITITEGTYGWRMDVEATAARLLENIKQNGSISMEAVWSSTGAAFTEENDVGDSYVEVDLTNQKVWLYKDGELLIESDCVSGSYSDESRKSPEGIYTIYYMQSPAVLRGADYTSEVDYWMAFYGNYGLHDANWRSEFGGDIYLSDGSHGCINLPDDAAQLIYETVSIGYIVVCYY